MIDSVPEIDAESTEGKHVAKATGRIQFIDVCDNDLRSKRPIILILTTRYISDTQLDPALVSFVVSISLLNLVPTLRLSELLDAG
jgi:hypothetical protein